MVAVEFHALDAVFVGLELDLPFSGSINSQLTVASTVLIWVAVSLGQSGFR